MLCMVDVGREKFGTTTTNSLKEMRTMLRAKPRDCANAMTSRCCNMASCIASIKQGKDMILAIDKVCIVGIGALLLARGLVFIPQHNMVM